MCIRDSLNLDIEYQNADLWGLLGGCERTPCTPLVTGLLFVFDDTYLVYVDARHVIKIFSVFKFRVLMGFKSAGL